MGGHLFAAGGGGAAGRGGGAAGRGGGATAIRGGGGGGAGRAAGGGGGAGRAAATGGAGRGGEGAAILGGGADSRGGGADTRGGGGGVGLAMVWGRGGGATWVTGGGAAGLTCVGGGASFSRRAGFSTGCTLACDCAGGDGGVGLVSPGFAGALAVVAGLTVLARSWTFGRAPPAGGAFDGVVCGVSLAFAGCEPGLALAPEPPAGLDVDEDVPAAAVPVWGAPLIAGAVWPGTGKEWLDGGPGFVSAVLGAVAVFAGLALPPAAGAVVLPVIGATGAPGFVAVAAPPVAGAPCGPVTVVPCAPVFAAALPVPGAPVGVPVAALPVGVVTWLLVFKAADPAFVVGSTETVLGSGALLSWIRAAF